MRTILDETQDERDLEIHRYTGAELEKIRSYSIDGNPRGPSIHLGGDFSAKSYDRLYRRLLYADLEEALRLFGAFIVTKRQKVIRRFCEMFDVRGTRILDFGCGVGSHGIYCAQLGAKQVDFLDVEGPMYRFCKWRAVDRGLEDRVKFLSTKSNLGKERYDFVICMDVMEHLADPLEQFKRVTLALKLRGSIALQVGTKCNPKQGHFRQSLENWTSRKCQNVVGKRLQLLEQYIYRRIG